MVAVQDSILSTTSRWQQVISDHIRAAYLVSPQQVQKVTANNGIITQAYFGGIENGELVLYKSVIRLFAGQVVPDEIRKIFKCSANNFCAIGETEIVEEFDGLTSQRAREEVATWKPSNTFAPSDYDLLRTARLVDLTIAYHQGIDVGGPIDAVQLNRDGSLRWFPRKENCPAD